MTPEHKLMLNSIRPGDTVFVKHGQGKVRAKVCQTAPFLVVEKFLKPGRKLQPGIISIFDVVAKLERELEVRDGQ
jgi:hypothetical protein